MSKAIDSFCTKTQRARYASKKTGIMQDPISLIADLGLPIASGLIMGYFIFLIMRQLMNGLVEEIKTIQGISKMLITRASIMNNDMIRIDTSVSSALNIPPDLQRIARAENFVEDGKIDARRD
ncbi:MAG: hypothetical protein CMF74_12905 [Maricaulis sp.]|nr:hypothetical protein [Maricaulis sp.]